MPNAVTDYGAQAWVGSMFAIGSLPSFWYLALCSNEPGEQWDGSILQDVEPNGADDYTGTVYSRQAIAADGSAWGLSDAGFVANVNDISFGVPDVDWGVNTHFGMTDDLLAGNLWLFGQFAEPILMDGTGEVFIAAGSIVISMQNVVSSIAV